LSEGMALLTTARVCAPTRTAQNRATTRTRILIFFIILSFLIISLNNAKKRKIKHKEEYDTLFNNLITKK
jgi:hypothetical protein